MLFERNPTQAASAVFRNRSHRHLGRPGWLPLPALPPRQRAGIHVELSRQLALNLIPGQCDTELGARPRRPAATVRAIGIGYEYPIQGGGTEFSARFSVFGYE